MSYSWPGSTERIPGRSSTSSRISPSSAATSKLRSTPTPRAWARLAFGMSMAIPFDCYLIDEVTSVGDARFQKRCEDAFNARRENADVIMVSHGMDTLRTWCQQGIVLINGRAIVYENIDDAIEVYRRLNA